MPLRGVSNEFASPMYPTPACHIPAHFSHTKMYDECVGDCCMSLNNRRELCQRLLLLNPSPIPPTFIFFSFESFFNKASIFHVDKETKLGCNGNSFHRYNYVQINHSVSRQENSRSRSRNSPPTLNPYPLYIFSFFLSFHEPSILAVRALTYVSFGLRTNAFDFGFSEWWRTKSAY